MLSGHPSWRGWHRCLYGICARTTRPTLAASPKSRHERRDLRRRAQSLPFRVCTHGAQRRLQRRRPGHHHHPRTHATPAMHTPASWPLPEPNLLALLWQACTSLAPRAALRYQATRPDGQHCALGRLARQAPADGFAGFRLLARAAAPDPHHGADQCLRRHRRVARALCLGRLPPCDTVPGREQPVATDRPRRRGSPGGAGRRARAAPLAAAQALAARADPA